MPPSDTFFASPSGWGWLVTLYFFVGGIAGGSYFLAAALSILGTPKDAYLARLGYYLAFPAAVLSALLLILDLSQPVRFWHMMIQSQTGLPMFKYWSPMSLGAWALLAFSGFTFVSFVGALIEDGHIGWTPPGILRSRILGKLFLLAGGLAGFVLAGYTGVLLSATNHPIWADTNLLGLVFAISAASTSAALLVLLGRGRNRAMPESLQWLTQLDKWVMVAELVALAALVVSLGSVAQAWFNVWGILLAGGVVLAGILVPLTLKARPSLLGKTSIPVAAGLVLIGGFILRVVVVFSSQTI